MKTFATEYSYELYAHESVWVLYNIDRSFLSVTPILVFKRRKVEIVTVGDYVTVRVPYQDRLAADLKRIPAVVVEVLGKKRLSYRLRYVV